MPAANNGAGPAHGQSRLGEETIALRDQERMQGVEADAAARRAAQQDQMYEDPHA